MARGERADCRHDVTLVLPYLFACLVVYYSSLHFLSTSPLYRSPLEKVAGYSSWLFSQSFLH